MPSHFDIETARALVACEGWAWPWECDGIESPHAFPYVAVDKRSPSVTFPGYYTRVVPWEGGDRLGLEFLPDITDPRVLGWCLWLVRRAWKDDSLSLVVPDEAAPRVWVWEDDGLDPAAAEYLQTPHGEEARSEPQAMLNALRAAEVSRG